LGWHQPGGKTTRVEAPPDAAVQMVWANMALHMAPDPQALIAQWHKALAVDGFLMFSCLGPDTLRELRGVYQQLGWPAPSHEFTDMHDWGDMLVAAGFAEPVMDMERITLSFESPQRLLAELRTLGRNLHPERFGGLRGRGWLGQLHRQLAQNLGNPNEEGRLTLTFEVIYGHALKPARRLNVQAETILSLDEMRQNLQQGKRPKTPG
jgi:malonyl-CoA O-methyltransferase